MEHSMEETTKATLLARLMEEIERAWNTRRDTDVVHRLATANPTLAEDLYEFFADVVEAVDDLDRDRPEFAASSRRIREWLEREGYRKATAAAAAAETSTTTPATPGLARYVAEGVAGGHVTFLGCLKQATGEKINSLAAALDITPDFLVVLSDNATVLPPKVRMELVLRAHKARGIDEGLLLSTFAAVAEPIQKAASRLKKYAPKAVTYADLVNSSKLDSARKRYWLTLA
jgi:hypothetical protein